MGIEGALQQGFVTTTLDKVVNWTRTGSLWPGILFHAAINSAVLIYVIGLLAHR